MINNDLFNQQCAVSAVFYTYSSELYEMNYYFTSKEMVFHKWI